MQQYLVDFHLQYKSIEESSALLPQPMKSICAFVTETVRSFESQYNLGKAGSRDMLAYVRPTVEKYIFGKLFDKLFQMYKVKNQKGDL